MDTLTFVGRKKELRLLRELRARIEASIGVVYGRRRIGKSELIAEAYKEVRVFTFEGLENQPIGQQLSAFLRQVEEYFPERKSETKNIKTWLDALILLSNALKDTSAVVVFDEFQWMSNYRAKLVSVLKLVWDRYFSKNKQLTLILCGSVASFMVNRVVKSKAIYGRVSQTIHLQEFKLAETAELLGKGSDEAILAQLLVGGVPGYLNLLKTKNSVYLGVQELAFEEHGYFVSEFERIFISQFGRASHYEKVVRTLQKFPQGLTRAELSQQPELSNGGSLSNYLYDLEIAGLISSYPPYSSGAKSSSRIYLVSDPYIRLYLSFIEPQLSDIRAGRPNLFITLSGSPGFNSWLGLACELLCYRHNYELAAIMGFSNVRYNVGPYFQTGVRNKKRGVQVDLVYERADKVITVCEIKYRTSPVGADILEEVDQKIALLPLKRGLTVQRALITKVAISDEVRDKGHFAHIVTLDQLVSQTRS